MPFEFLIASLMPLLSTRHYAEPSPDVVDHCWYMDEIIITEVRQRRSACFAVVIRSVIMTEFDRSYGAGWASPSATPGRVTPRDCR